MKILNKIWDAIMFCFAPLFFEEESDEDIQYDVTEDYYHK